MVRVSYYKKKSTSRFVIDTQPNEILRVRECKMHLYHSIQMLSALQVMLLLREVLLTGDGSRRKLVLLLISVSHVGSLVHVVVTPPEDGGLNEQGDGRTHPNPL